MRIALALTVVFVGGCGEATFYEETQTCPAGPPVAAAAEPAPPPERPGQRDGFQSNLVSLIHEPVASDAPASSRACRDSLHALRVEVSNAIDLAIGQNDFRGERCLSDKAKAIGTFYRVSLGYTYRDQHGEPIELDSACPAVALARAARGCFARPYDDEAMR